MDEFVTDTMALVLRLEVRRMGAVAKTAFEAMEAGTAVIYVPGLVFAELLYLSEKRRISITLHDVGQYLAQFPNCREYALNLAVVYSASQINDIPELHDRPIAATARLLDRELISNDPIIQASTSVRTVWQSFQSGTIQGN